MKKIEIRGIVPPIVALMNEDETINEGGLRNQVNRRINGGVHGLFPFKISGEGHIPSEAEKEQVLSIVIDEIKGCIPAYAGTRCVNTRDTIRQSGMAKSPDADMLSIITLSFATASQSELYEHYKAVAGAVDVPIVLYNIPTRTDNSLALATVARLSRIEDIVGAKDSPGNFNNMLQYIEQTHEGGGFAVLSGNDSLALWNLLTGGAGDVAGCADVLPEVMASVYDSFTTGDLEGIRKTQDSTRSFRTCLKRGNPDAVVKTAIAFLEYPVGKCRAPFNQIPEEEIEALKKVLAENHKKGMC